MWPHFEERLFGWVCDPKTAPSSILPHWHQHLCNLSVCSADVRCDHREVTLLPSLRLDIIYIYLYTSAQVTNGVDDVSDDVEKTKLATVVWEGDSREVLKAFPQDVTQNLGFELWRLQQSERPKDYRPLPSVGPGVFELRDQDERAWYRVVYLSRIENVIYILHCFEKKSREMPRRDFEKARQRLKAVKARLAEEKKREKHS
jgi:phage-related protein